MKKVSRLLFSSELAALAFFLLTSGAKAAPIQWAAADGGNDHYYDFVLPPDISWHAARDAAASLSFLGSQGHLVTVTSAAEDTFLRTNFSSQIGDPRPPLTVRLWCPVCMRGLASPTKSRKAIIVG